MSKILRLSVQNVKRISAVEIRPDPKDGLVIIRGENGQGKSSVLDSIAYAIGGKTLQPPKVIRDGEESAEVVIETEDMIITRRFTAAGQQLSVSTKDGAKFSAPQGKLDELVGRLSFDPLSFMRLEPKAQAEAVRKLVGIDFSQLDAKRAQTFAERTLVNREVAQLDARIKALPPAEAFTAVDVAALLAELEQLQQQETASRALADKKAAIVRDGQIQNEKIKATEAEIADLEQRLQAARAKLTDQVAHRDTLRRNVRDVDGELAMIPIVGPDLERVREQLRNAESINAKARAQEDRRRLEQQVVERSSAAVALSNAIEAIDAEKAKTLAAASFPVPGLSFGEAGVTLNELPLEQASSAEQLRVSVAMGLALNPRLRVLLVRDGSLLDSNSLALVAGMAEAAGAQVWIEIVGKDGDGIVIEDGTTASSPPPGLELPPPDPALDNPIEKDGKPKGKRQRKAAEQ